MHMVCKAREKTVRYYVTWALHLVPGVSFNWVNSCDTQNNNKMPPFNIIDNYNVWRHSQYHGNSWMRTFSWVNRYSQNMLRSIVHGVKKFNFIRGSPRDSFIAVRHSCIIFFKNNLKKKWNIFVHKTFKPCRGIQWILWF